MAKKKVTKKKTVKKAVRTKTKPRTTTTRKTASKKKAATKTKPARKKPAATKKPAAAKKTKPAGKATVTRKTTVKKKATPKKTAPKKTTANIASKKSPQAASLGRPRVPADARLDIVFQKDYQAREIFDFLGVTTVRELERFGADEIIRRLTSPMIQTVGRIRKALAVANRSLVGDQKFAQDFQKQFKLGK
jgi:hypothetical protein